MRALTGSLPRAFLVLIFALAAVVPLSVRADVVQNDIAADPPSVTINAGAAASVSFRITATNNDFRGCNVDLTHPATISFSVAGAVTASPSQLVFTACSVWQPATFSASAAGTYTVTVGSVTGGNPGSTWNTSPATFTLNVLAPTPTNTPVPPTPTNTPVPPAPTNTPVPPTPTNTPVPPTPTNTPVPPTPTNTPVPPSPTPADTTAPVIQPAISGTQGSNGWYRSSVTVTWSVTDPESGIASSSGCGTFSITSDTAGTVVACSATNGAGLVGTQSVTIKRDATPPTLSSSPAPGTYLVTRGASVSGSASAADATSGVQSCGLTINGATAGTCSSFTLPAGTAQVVAYDAAGNRTLADYTVEEVLGPARPLRSPSEGSAFFKIRSTIPVKFQLQTTSQVTTARGTVCVSANCAAFKWDARGRQYVANLPTRNLRAGVYNVVLNVTGGANGPFTLGSVRLAS